MALKVNVKEAGKGYQIQLSGDEELAKIDPRKIQDFVTSRVACASRNRCSQTRRTIAEQLNCVSLLAERRIARVGQTVFGDEPVQVTVKTTAGGLQISITGAQADAVKGLLNSDQIEKGLTAVKACRQTNRCGARDQSLAERWQCVSTLGARRFAKV